MFEVKRIGKRSKYKFNLYDDCGNLTETHYLKSESELDRYPLGGKFATVLYKGYIGDSLYVQHIGWDRPTELRRLREEASK